MILFSLGGLFAIYEAVEKYQEVLGGHPNALLEGPWWWVPLAVLGFAILAEGFSLRTAVHESRPAKGTQTWFRFIRTSKSPQLPVVLLEDSAALIGLAFALLGGRPDPAHRQRHLGRRRHRADRGVADRCRNHLGCGDPQPVAG